MDETDVARRDAEAARQVRDLVGIPPEVDALLAALRELLGPDQTQRCVAAVQMAPLTRRQYALAGLASAVVALKYVGTTWWHETRPRDDLAEGGSPVVLSPAELIDSVQLTPTPSYDAAGRWQPSAVERLGWCAADDIADQLWGAAVGFADLNHPAGVTRAAVPDGAVVGKRLLLSWDVGCRVWAVVEHRPDGTMGMRQEGELLFAPPADASWAWSICVGLGPHRLPGEEPGTRRDPYAARIDYGAAETLRHWALDREPNQQTLERPWTTSQTALAALAAMETERRPGSWFVWSQAMLALIDRDQPRLKRHTNRL